MKPLQWTGSLLMVLAFLMLCHSGWAEDPARQEYDKMVEEAVREAEAYLEEREERNRQQQAATENKAQTAFQQKVRAEAQRIVNEMDQVRHRGLAPNFTQGMKENLMNELQAQLDRLISDPEAYFEKK